MTCAGCECGAIDSRVRCLAVAGETQPIESTINVLLAFIAQYNHDKEQ